MLSGYGSTFLLGGVLPVARQEPEGDFVKALKDKVWILGAFKEGL